METGLATFVLDAFAGALPPAEVDPELDQLTALRKLQLASRHELSRWAVQRRLVDPDG